MPLQDPTRDFLPTRLRGSSSAWAATSEFTTLPGSPRRTKCSIPTPRCKNCEASASGVTATCGSVQNSTGTWYVLSIPFLLIPTGGRVFYDLRYSDTPRILPGLTTPLQTGVFKQQTEWIPLSSGATQGRTLAVAQVNGMGQSFNTVNSLRILGRWMRMFAIQNQISVPEADEEFGPEEEGSRMLPGSNRDRLVDCMEELVKFTLVMRPHFDLFQDRFSSRKSKLQGQAQG